MKTIVITVLAALAMAAATATAVSAQVLNLSGQFQCVKMYRAKPRIEHALQPLFFFYCSLTSPGGCTAEISPYVPVATLRIDCLPSSQLRNGP